MTEEQGERIATALESIAASLVEISRPVRVVGANGQVMLIERALAEQLAARGRGLISYDFMDT